MLARIQRELGFRVPLVAMFQVPTIERLAARFFVDHLKPPQDRHFQPLAQYFTDLQAGTLPAYSFIEPQYFDTPFGRASASKRVC